MSIVVAVLTVVPSSEGFSVLMRRAVNDTGGVITSYIMHACMGCTPGSSFPGSLVRGVISR